MLYLLFEQHLTKTTLTRRLRKLLTFLKKREIFARCFGQFLLSVRAHGLWGESHGVTHSKPFQSRMGMTQDIYHTSCNIICGTLGQAGHNTLLCRISMQYCDYTVVTKLKIGRYILLALHQGALIIVIIMITV